MLVGVLVCLLLLFGCDEPAHRDIQPLRIGMIRWSGVDLVHFQSLKQTSVPTSEQIAITLFLDINDARRAMQRGRLDVLIASAWSLVDMPTGDEAYTVFLVISQSNGADGIVAQKEVTSLNDLKNRTIGVESGTTDELLWRIALAKTNLKDTDVNKYSGSTGRTLELLRTGELAAAVTFEPYLSQIKAQIDGNVLFSTRDTEAAMIDVAFARQSVLRERRPAIQHFVNQWFSTVDTFSKDPNSVISAVSRHFVSSPNEMRNALKAIRIGDQALNKHLLSNPEFLKNFAVQYEQISGTHLQKVPETTNAFVLNHTTLP